MEKLPQIHLIGGFLGSGKTTAIAMACKLLADRKLTAGVITNDQGKYLVDTAFFDLNKIPAVQVANGCFCCNYDDLTARMDQLVRAVQPDVIFAESVGSCADIIATVIKPLHELEQASGGKATLTVFADTRLLSMWLDGQDLPFSEDVMYVFGKQLEEAGLLVLNKRDLVSPDRALRAMEIIRDRFPGKPIRLQNSLDPFQVETWIDELNALQTRPGIMKSLSIDYTRYAAGEAALGWLDAHLAFQSPNRRDFRPLVLDWISNLVQEFRSRHFGIGHLKFIFHAGKSDSKVSITSGDSVGWRAQVPEMNAKELKVLVNARVEADPSVVRELVINAAQTSSLKAGVQMEELDAQAFRPGFPKPKRRVS